MSILKTNPDFKVLVAGGRDFTDFNYLTRMLDSVLRKKCKSHSIVIISGKAQGADSLGEKYAKLRGYKVSARPADWKDITREGAVIKSNKFGKYNAVAGHMRNEDMAVECDVGVVFWDGYSTGTEDMIKRLNNHKKSMKTFSYLGDTVSKPVILTTKSTKDAIVKQILQLLGQLET